MKELYKKGSCVRKGLYESFKVENPTGAKGSRFYLKITFSSEPFPVTYGDLLPEERCLSCFCCTPCASECGCDGRGEDEDGQVRRILGIDFNDERVVEAETARRKFVRESEAMFSDQNFFGVEEEEEEEESETNVESSFDSDD